MHLRTFLTALLISPMPLAAPLPASGGMLAEFLLRVETITGPAERRKAAADFMAGLRRSGGPLTGDSSVSFVFFGKASRVRLASDLNGWNPGIDTMARLAGTDLYYAAVHVDPAARFEYKFIVDSTWILDPLNSRRAEGGMGLNSEVWMPAYRPPAEIVERPHAAHGRLDTLLFRSSILGRAIPVTVYVPRGKDLPHVPLPVLFVLDGGEYLSLGRMSIVLDNLIADGAIAPLVCIFLDPRTNPADAQTSMRMTDYTMSDAFLRALVTEVHPFLRTTYGFSDAAAETGIMGASLGGLAAVHAAFERPDVFGFCAAQSPSLWFQDARMLKRLEREAIRPLKIHIDTGTIRDAQDESRRARDILTARGYVVQYEEHPEGHNWANWRARVGSILRFFGGHP